MVSGHVGTTRGVDISLPLQLAPPYIFVHAPPLTTGYYMEAEQAG